MKHLLKLFLIISLVAAGLFVATPTLAETNTTSYKAGDIEVQAAVADRIYIPDRYKGGPVLDYYFVTTTQNGYQYRGYLSLSKIYYGGATYSGYLYRAPLPYPIY